ncbi:MAG TPA: sigma-70 family RNA polymerase sigma factor [Thermoanaerobaculia bacterium]|jgi:RNA polymerase sigma factor (TIGR02999 family)|nr:sigma-70 family RNA polymerase sigma factor [Thermoanaerobaculia bacterium]
MAPPGHGEVTALLKDWSGGDQRALERLTPLVYDELRKLAGGYMRGERPDHTFQPTALVHEAYLRLVDQRDVDWHNRAHFFGIAAQMMRRVLVDHARRRQAAKRGAVTYRISVSDELADAVRDPELLGLDRALEALSKLDPRQARIVELRFFGGLTVEEVAEVTGISTATVKREWQTARARLAREIHR